LPAALLASEAPLKDDPPLADVVLLVDEAEELLPVPDALLDADAPPLSVADVLPVEVLLFAADDLPEVDALLPADAPLRPAAEVRPSEELLSPDAALLDVDEPVRALDLPVEEPELPDAFCLPAWPERLLLLPPLLFEVSAIVLSFI
jgi:hypothetical protein